MGATKPAKERLTYASSGVSIDEGDSFVRAIQAHLRRTHGPRVIANPGGFAGLFRLDFNEDLYRRNFREPVLVACADGVGTKVKIAREMNRWDTVGQDLVAMNLNDLVVQGAEPLFFLDYIACGKLDNSLLEEVIRGIANACRYCSTALLGGETAEMPDVYAEHEIDLAGFGVGVVELGRVTEQQRVEDGDVVIGLMSSGVHSNGFSLVRAIVEKAGLDLKSAYSELGDDRVLGEWLLEPTRLYARPVVRIMRRYKVKRIVSAMAHITGGGLDDNLCRSLHPQVDAIIDIRSWDVPALFRFLQSRGDIDEQEMRRVFNMGIGFCMIVRPSFASSIERQLLRLGESPVRIGRIVHGTGVVRIED